MSFLGLGMDYTDPKRKSNVAGKLILAACLTALCILMLKQSPSFNTPSMVISTARVYEDYFKRQIDSSVDVIV